MRLYAGIKEKLSHFQYLNVKAIWISPFYKSPMKDFGYDVEDFRDIDPIFGTMADFDELLSSMHSMGEQKPFASIKKRFIVKIVLVTNVCYCHRSETYYGLHSQPH